MSKQRELSTKMRLIHRYLGFFLAGIMFVYSLSGITMIFRDTDFLKKENLIEKELPKNLDAEEVGKAIRIKRLEFTSIEGDLASFKQGTYNLKTGKAKYTVKSLPFIVNKMEHLHKAKSGQPLFFLNIFFGLGLLFFVISSFWMFLPKTTIFKKGLYFTAAGIVLTLILLFI